MTRHFIYLLVVMLWMCHGCALAKEIDPQADQGPGVEADQGIVQPDLVALPIDMMRQTDLDAPADMSPIDQGMHDMGMHDMDMTTQDLPVITPPGWWDGRWSMRLSLRILQGWDEEIVLPVRVPGALSDHAGHELRVILNNEPTPLPHETEVWVDEVDNVVWVRFPEGFTLGDTLHIYSGVATAPDEDTQDPAGTWRGLARHVYHFDGGGETLDHDSVAEGAIHFAKTPAPNAPYLYDIPNARMGRHIKLTEFTEPLESTGSISPIHVNPQQDTTIEYHVSVSSFSSQYIMSDENRCVGNTVFFGMNTFGYRHQRGQGCPADGYPELEGGQTINDFMRVYVDTPYLVFSRFDWVQMEHKSWVNDTNKSATKMLRAHPDGDEVTPSRLFIASTPFTPGVHTQLELDTLIVHDRALSTSEMTLRWQATHHNDEIFERGSTEQISP